MYGDNSTGMIIKHLSETLKRIESLIAMNAYSGNLDKAYDVIEKFSLYMPVRYLVFI